MEKDVYVIKYVLYIVGENRNEIWLERLRSKVGILLLS